MDENGLAVPGAQVILKDTAGGQIRSCTSDYSGSCRFPDEGTGPFRIHVEKTGFYVFESRLLTSADLKDLEVTLNHEQEFSEKVDVVSSQRVLTTQKTDSAESLSRQEILNLPYPSTRDFRNALSLLPGVLQDGAGQIHVNGSETSQIVDQIDGFNITNPGTGALTLRVSTDALRSVEILSGRYSAENGKGSGGVLNLETGMGDDRFRFSATNFFPSLQTRGGLAINSWTPRATLSGPIAKGRAWFFDAVDGEYHLHTVSELPSGADQSRSWRGGNLAKIQLNWSPTHVLTASLLLNRLRSDHPELSRFRPLETTTNQRGKASLVTVREQFFFQNQALLEAGFGIYTSDSAEHPLGDATYVIRPGIYGGNYYRNFYNWTRRSQGILRFTLPPILWNGPHTVRMGADIDHLAYRQDNRRGAIAILREDGTLSRDVHFSATDPQTDSNIETGAFVEDRWRPHERLQVELGVRFDRDRIIQDTLISPRLAASYLIDGGRTKISAGTGIFHDATPLDLITGAAAGERTDRFFGPDGETVEKVATTSFQVNRKTLRSPRFLNWSIEIQRELSHFDFVTASWLQRRGHNGFVQERLHPNPLQGGPVELRNSRQDRYWSLEFTFRRSIPGSSEFFAAYTRSSARSNAVLNFDIDNPIFGSQGAGPLLWDSPDRLQVWGWHPVPLHLLRRFEVAYGMEWRTGFPFSIVNDRQELLGDPNAYRYPAYFSLSIHLGRRFPLFGYLWALRVGANNLTDRPNATSIDNNIDSPNFLALGGVQGRVITGRIRFLGHP
jgi:outer membrane receptor protein involved in Fe transport